MFAMILFMIGQNKTIQSKSESQKRADLDLAKLGMRPYNREDEPIDDSGETTYDKITIKEIESEKAIGKIAVDFEIVVPNNVSQQAQLIIGSNPLEELVDTPTQDSFKPIDFSDKKAS